VIDFCHANKEEKPQEGSFQETIGEEIGRKKEARSQEEAGSQQKVCSL
jgi:hypothetical protein